MEGHASPVPMPVTTVPLISFDRSHRILLACLASWFLGCVLLKLHGYSLPVWHEIVDDSNPKEKVFGRLRPIRSDDYLLDLPIAISQARTNPSLPVINPNIGDGQNMLAPIRAPVWHPTMAFRPSVWGFVLGEGYGLSWMWWFQQLGLFYSMFLLFMLVSRNHFTMSTLLAASLAYSPLAQQWSLHKAEIPILGGAVWVGAVYLLFSRSKKQIIAAGVGVGWAASAMALNHIYPPIQVVCGLLMLSLLVGFVWERHREFHTKSLWIVRLAAVVLGLGIIAAVMASFWISAAEHLSQIIATTYPGQRFSLGGGMPLHYFLSNNFLVSLKITQWQPFGNPCEVAFGFIFLPLSILVLLGDCWRNKTYPGAIPLLLILISILLYVYSYAGVPSWMAHVTMLGKSTSNRTQYGLLIADYLVLLLVFGPRTKSSLTPFRWDLAYFGLWLALLTAAALSLRQVSSEMTDGFLAAGLILNALLAWILVMKRKPVKFMACLLLVTYLSTLRFNPMVRDGTKYLVENPVSKTILEIQKAEGPGKWIVMLTDESLGGVSNLLRMIPVQSLGGFLCSPPLAIFNKLDEGDAFKPIYNQCGFFNFFPTANLHTTFETPSPGQVRILASPNHPVFKELGYNFFLFAGTMQPELGTTAGLTLIKELGRFRFYKRILVGN